MGSAVVIYRIRSLWDHNRHVTFAILTMFLLVVVTMIISSVFEVMHLSSMSFGHHLAPLCIWYPSRVFCGYSWISGMLISCSGFKTNTVHAYRGYRTRKPFYNVGLSRPQKLKQIVWDIFNLVVFTSNAFSTPYQCSTDVLARFKHDGGRYFLCLLGDDFF